MVHSSSTAPFFFFSGTRGTRSGRRRSMTFLFKRQTVIRTAVPALGRHRPTETVLRRFPCRTCQTHPYEPSKCIPQCSITVPCCPLASLRIPHESTHLTSPRSNPACEPDNQAVVDHSLVRLKLSVSR